MKEKIKQSLSQLKTTLPALFLAFNDRETPILAKILAFLTIAYALSPIDLIPDFIPVLGYLNDAVILPLLAALSIKLIPQPVWKRCLEKEPRHVGAGQAQEMVLRFADYYFLAIDYLADCESRH